MTNQIYHNIYLYILINKYNIYELIFFFYLYKKKAKFLNKKYYKIKKLIINL